MKTLMRLFLLAASLLAVAVSPLRAQLVNDGATTTLSNVTNIISGDVTVGTNVQLSAAVGRAGEEHCGRGLLTLEKSFPSA